MNWFGQDTKTNRQAISDHEQQKKKEIVDDYVSGHG